MGGGAERRLTTGHVHYVHELLPTGVQRWYYVETGGQVPGFSVRPELLGGIVLDEGDVIFVEVNEHATQEGELHPRIILESDNLHL